MTRDEIKKLVVECENELTNEFKEIDEKEKNCMAVTEAADYLVTFREGYYYKDAFLKRTQPFYLQEKIPVIKKKLLQMREMERMIICHRIFRI